MTPGILLRRVFIPGILLAMYLLVLLIKLPTASVTVVKGLATRRAKLPAAPSTVCAAFATPAKELVPEATEPKPDIIPLKVPIIALPIPGRINIMAI